MKKKFLTAAIVGMSMVMFLFVFTACGGSSGGDAESADTKTTPTTEAVDPLEKYTGSWSLAAVESQGVMMSGNFGELLEIDEDGMLKINADGTGSMKLDKDPVSFTWEETADNTISLKAEQKTDNTGTNIDITYKDEALFMSMEEDDQEATGIFTHDGTYAEAKTISVKDAEDITSEDELLGKWKMTGMNMAGISIYGKADSLEQISGGADMSITFKEGGVAVMEDGDGTWTVGKDGAAITMSGITGEMTCPVKKLDDGIVIDMTEAFGGTEFITLLEK